MENTIRKISQEIIECQKFNPDTTLKEVVDAFYAIMKKYKITKFTKMGQGFQGDNFEWTMCKTLFFEMFISGLELDVDLNYHDVGNYPLPKELYYSEKESQNGNSN